jgi:hypothetical protein
MKTTPNSTNDSIVNELTAANKRSSHNSSTEAAAVCREIEIRRTGIFRLSDDERRAIRNGIDAARRGDFASDDEVEKFYQRHRKA